MNDLPFSFFYVLYTFGYTLLFLNICFAAYWIITTHKTKKEVVA